MEIYSKLKFTKRTKNFETFLPENAQLPKTNPPYPSSMFPGMTKQIISIVACMLGYHLDQWVDEIILAFLSLFSWNEKPDAIFCYNEFLAEIIDDQFMKLSIVGVLKYASILEYLFLFYQSDKFPFQLQNIDSQGNTHLVIHWTNLVRKNNIEFTFNDFVDQFLHVVASLLNSDAEPKTHL